MNRFEISNLRARFGGSRIACLCVLSALVGSTAWAQSGGTDPEAVWKAKARDERLLLLAAAEFDPLAGVPTLPRGFTWGDEERAAGRGAAAGDTSGDRSDYFILQLRARVTPDDRVLLAALGAEPLEYLPNNAFLVRSTAAALPGLRSWSRTRALVPFEPAYRIDPDLLAADAITGEDALDLMVVLFAGADTADVSLRILEAGGALADWDAAWSERLLVRMPATALATLARIRDVQWIQRAPVAMLRNGTTTWVVQSDVQDQTPVWTHGVLGDGVIIGHIDGAIDLNACWFNDPNVSAPGPTHRKVVSHHGSYNRPDAHGTHTSGTAAGDQEPITGAIDDNGIAYHARLAHTNLNLISGSNLFTKLDVLYADGARLFTNSWGNDSTSKYDTWCHDIDDLCWQHPDALVFFAVSNGTRVTNPENAKNLLAVSGAEQAPNEDDHCTGGKGPTSDGRRRPEVMEPGCNIHSAKSGTSCGTRTMDGTSMACPAMTGAAALVLQYFRDGWYPSGTPNAADGFPPSGALIKAAVIDSGRDMTGISGFPSVSEGWGRPTLDDVLYFTGDTRKLWAVDVAAAQGLLAAGQAQSWFFDVLGGVEPLDLCLCFTDAPAAVNASFAPVNDIDVEVVAPDGTLYLGNVFSGGVSISGGSADPLNNVERVRLAAPLPGRYTLTVRATTIATATAQGYALVASGDLDPPHTGSFTAYGAGLAGSGGLVPVLGGSGAPVVGGAVALDLSNGVGGAQGVLVVGFARANLPFAGGALLVLPPWLLIDLQLGGTPGLPGDGSLSFPGTIPNDPSLVDLLVDFQGILFDPGASQGVALTQGLELKIGG